LPGPPNDLVAASNFRVPSGVDLAQGRAWAAAPSPDTRRPISESQDLVQPRALSTRGSFLWQSNTEVVIFCVLSFELVARRFLAANVGDLVQVRNAQTAWGFFLQQQRTNPRLNTATRAVFPPVRGTDVKQTACPHINPAAILVATARKLQRVEAISVQHRYHQIAVARNRVQRSNEVPHKGITYGTPADAALI
jgi:hypothetical protein